ncbi:hypothetical protein PACTADRAFT_42302 [Pachysolen tannophilus NRRL Y-2460]|uniref:Amino acid permease/ SLC12A domain-containing protein n=1 Tax=Pachysolen tannophilus NRRL Y-2460 TaxID=669874 RepID=A0A1E4TV89_PACTA|nr:hypothetical protein PACTADRAFT_42302 [Pachysolen tannophilus NRRL Y-2460]
MINPDDSNDDFEEVEHFNYKQDLKRRLTASSLVGLGFSLMSVPFGISTTLGIGLVDGGNVTILWGWVVVSILSLCVVASLCEIAGKYPTSGGVYHFAAILSNEKYSLGSSWFTGWFLIMGNWTMAISILYGGAQFILSIFGLKDVYYKKDTILTLLLFYCLVILCGLVNLQFSKILDRVNDACTYWTIYTVLLIDILLMLFSNSFHDVKYILTNFNATRSGWPDVIAFLVGLQPAAFTLQGYGMIMSMSDEVKKPVEKILPKGMIYSVFIAGVTGVIFIIPILSILPELSLILDQNPDIMPIDLVFKLSTESFIVSFLLVILLIGTVLFAGIGSLTTASRSTYAFARDGGLPYKDLWIHVDEMDDESVIPKNALFLSMAVCFILGLLSLVSSSAFNAFMGAAVIALSFANGVPLVCLVMGKRKKIRGSSFKLKKAGWILNLISLLWIALTFIILCMPPEIPVSITSMNYAIVVFVVFFITIFIGYKFWGKYHFQGPLIDKASGVELNSVMESIRENNSNTIESATSTTRSTRTRERESNFIEPSSFIVAEEISDSTSTISGAETEDEEVQNEENNHQEQEQELELDQNQNHTNKNKNKNKKILFGDTTTLDQTEANTNTNTTNTKGYTKLNNNDVFFDGEKLSN